MIALKKVSMPKVGLTLEEPLVTDGSWENTLQDLIKVCVYDVLLFNISKIFKMINFTVIFVA